MICLQTITCPRICQCFILVLWFPLLAMATQPTLADKARPSEERAAAYRKLFEKAGRNGLVELTHSKDTSTALQASWESHKKLVKPGNVWMYDAESINKFINDLKAKTKATVPEWWQKGLFSVAVFKGQNHSFSAHNWWRGDWVKEVKIGDKTWRVPPSVTLTQKTDTFTLRAKDLLVEYPKAARRHFADSFEFVVSDKAACVAAYDSWGGHEFNVVGFEAEGGKQLWTADIWATDMTESVGASACHRVELLVNKDTLFVFGAEIMGLYVEGFEVKTGKNQFRFCTCYWGNFSERWEIK